MIDRDIIEESLSVVEELNDYVVSILGEDTHYSFTAIISQYRVDILFDAVYLWDSENDPRGWILDEETGAERIIPLLDYIKESFNEYAAAVRKLKFVEI